jgi:hypothetical protein
MSKYWFKARSYGWGIGLPICWQGWLSLAFLIFLILLVAYVSGVFEKIGYLKAYLRFSLGVMVLSLLFVFLFQDKVEGGIKWRWGKNT